MHKEQAEIKNWICLQTDNHQKFNKNIDHLTTAECIGYLVL